MPPKTKTELHIGTSGWTYDGWRGSFYPQDIPKHCWLQFYASVFNSAEINGSFYRTPSLEAVRGWRENTPPDFTYAWKASKFITHWKRLTEKCENSIELMETRLKVLGPKAAVVLFQLPPQFKKNEPRLRSFLKMLPKKYRYAFEFRDRAWYEDDVLHTLAERNVALCISDHHDAPAPFEVTARHVYLRGHGPGGKYRGSYPNKTLDRWAEYIGTWRRERRDVFVYFDNDQKAAAPRDAVRLIERLE